MNKIAHRISRINIKGLNTTIDSILRPGALLEGNPDKYLSATNYFFSLIGLAFFLIVAKGQLDLEPPTEFYSAPERLVSYFSMEENFEQEYGFYFPFLVVIPFAGLVLSLLFRDYPLKKIFSLLFYFFGTCALYVSIYLMLFPGSWVLSTTLVAYAVYYSHRTTYGKYWVRLLKMGITVALTVSFIALVPFQRMIQYAYYRALHSDKILYETPEPELVSSKLVLEDYLEDTDGYHVADIGNKKLFYTINGQSRKLHLFDSEMLQSDTITINGRIIHFEELNLDSLVIISAIKGQKDSSEYAQVTFLAPSNLQFLDKRQLPTEFYTINDARWNESLWICGAQLTNDRIIIPNATELRLLQDSIQTIQNIQLPDVDNGRGRQIAIFNDQVFLTTYKKEDVYIYDLSVYTLNPPGSYQLFEKRTQYSPSTSRPVSFMSVNETDGTLVTSRGTNDKLSTFPSITIFPMGDLATAISVEPLKVADEFVVDDIMIQNDQIHVCGLVNYLMTADFRRTTYHRYGIYLRISLEGEILEKRIFAPNADHHFEPVKFLSISDSSVSILGREYWQRPVLGRKQNLIEAQLVIGQ